MTEDEPSADEETTVDRTAAERLATAPERAAVGAELERHQHEGAPEAGEDAEDEDAGAASDQAEKTDMSAVGDDGQVFGG
jgi:hypothetical protein